MPYAPAKSEVLRTFVVLESAAIFSGLSALDGGAVDEILTHVTEDRGSELEGQLGVSSAKGKGGRRKKRTVQEELRRKRTEHSAAASLIDRLSAAEAIGEVDGEVDEEVAAALTPGHTVRLQGRMVLHPLHEADAMLRSFLKAAPAYGEEAAAKELRREVLPLWEAMVGSGDSAIVLFDLVTRSPQVPRVLMPVKRSALEVTPSDAQGFVTVLAKADEVLGPDDETLAIRVLQNAPVSKLERSAVEEAAVDIVEGLGEMGVTCTREDLIMRGPSVVLKPLCIWR